MIHEVRDPTTQKLLGKFDSETDTFRVKISSYIMSLNMTSGELHVVDDRRGINTRMCITSFRNQRSE